MIATPIQLGYSLVSTGYLTEALWHAYDHKPTSIPLNMILWMELIANTCIMCYATFCLILMYNKRDILPKHIKRLYISVLIVVFIDTTLSQVLLPDVKQSYKDVIRGIINVCVWVPYFSMSVRVKETFTVPYGEYIAYEPVQNETIEITETQEQNPEQKFE
jgi:hypothetical protein